MGDRAHSCGERYRPAAPGGGTTGALARGVTDGRIGSDGWLGGVFISLLALRRLSSFCCCGSHTFPPSSASRDTSIRPSEQTNAHRAVSYTHLTLPTKRIV